MSSKRTMQWNLGIIYEALINWSCCKSIAVLLRSSYIVLWQMHRNVHAVGFTAALEQLLNRYDREKCRPATFGSDRGAFPN